MTEQDVKAKAEEMAREWAAARYPDVHDEGYAPMRGALATFLTSRLTPLLEENARLSADLQKEALKHAETAAARLKAEEERDRLRAASEKVLSAFEEGPISKAAHVNALNALEAALSKDPA